MSKLITRFAASVMLVVLGAQAAYSQTWRTYRNARYGISGDYPRDWIALPPAINGDGRSFRAPGTNATITISGAPLHASQGSELQTRGYPDEGEQITYTRHGPNWVVVSGIKLDDTVFYRKSMISCLTIGQISIEYPVAEKRRYDSLVAHVANSLDDPNDQSCLMPGGRSR